MYQGNVQKNIDIHGHNTRRKFYLHTLYCITASYQRSVINKGIKLFNPLAPNDVYIRRTAQLTSRRCILNIYSTNILTEYFKHAARSPFIFSSRCRLFHNAIFFGSCNIQISNTGCAKI